MMKSPIPYLLIFLVILVHNVSFSSSKIITLSSSNEIDPDDYNIKEKPAMWLAKNDLYEIAMADPSLVKRMLKEATNNISMAVFIKFKHILMSLCPKKLSLDQEAMKNVLACSNGVTEMNIPTGDDDDQKARCKLWPKYKRCCDYIFRYLERCFENKYVEKLVNRAVNYACSASQHGLFEKHVITDFQKYVKTCPHSVMGSFISCVVDNVHLSKKDICPLIVGIRNCGEEAFLDCSSPKPWEILSRGVDEIYFEFDCDRPEYDN